MLLHLLTCTTEPLSQSAFFPTERRLLAPEVCSKRAQKKAVLLQVALRTLLQSLLLCQAYAEASELRFLSLGALPCLARVLASFSKSGFLLPHLSAKLSLFQAQMISGIPSRRHVIRNPVGCYKKLQCYTAALTQSEGISFYLRL
jgi:hypothetical protein